jgi:SAM-dependent methyltransferase
MDDKTFNDRRIALAWIGTVEAESARIRDEDIYPRLKTWLNRVSPLEILEIGSGQGVCSDKIDLDGRTYIGLEPSPFLVDRAKELYSSENRHFLSGSAYHLPFADGVFDAAFSVAVWHLFSDLGKAAEELNRVLRPNGNFLIITANPAAYSLWTDRYSETKLEGRRFKGNVRSDDGSVLNDVLYLHTNDEIQASLQGAGLAILDIETFRTSEKSAGQKYFMSIAGRPASP